VFALLAYFSDINECLESSSCGLPHQKCVNIPGSFKCVCEDGFVASRNGSCQVRSKSNCCYSVTIFIWSILHYVSIL